MGAGQLALEWGGGLNATVIRGRTRWRIHSKKRRLNNSSNLPVSAGNGGGSGYMRFHLLLLTNLLELGRVRVLKSINQLINQVNINVNKSNQKLLHCKETQSIILRHLVQEWRVRPTT